MHLMTRALALFALSTVPALAASWTVDAGHSRVGFAIDHMMVSTVRGEFGTFSGTMEYDPANVAATKVTGLVTVSSVDTRDTKRDDHLKSADFFDVSKYTDMKFTSKSVKNITDADFDLVGDLTIHGVTKEITLKVTKPKPEMKDPWGNVKTGLSATGTINRKDFGLTWNTALDGGGYIIGDNVALQLDIELAKNK